MIYFTTGTLRSMKVNDFAENVVNDRRMIHSSQLMVQHSWVKTYALTLHYEYSFIVAPIELWTKLTAKAVNAPLQAVSGGLIAMKQAVLKVS